MREKDVGSIVDDGCNDTDSSEKNYGCKDVARPESNVAAFRSVKVGE